MTQLQASDVPGMGRRQFMNLLMFGAATGVALGALYPVVSYFIPPKPGGSGGGTTAKDALGNDVTASGWLAGHPEGDRSLVQGLKGDPTYLLVQGEATLAGFGVNAVCTHLGCVVPWNAGKNRFICPATGPNTMKTARWCAARRPSPWRWPTWRRTTTWSSSNHGRKRTSAPVIPPGGPDVSRIIRHPPCTQRSCIPYAPWSSVSFWLV